MPYKSALCLLTGVVLGYGLHQGTASTPQKYTIADFPDLGKGLKEIPGCLDIKTGRLGNRGEQQSIFAWFKDKKSVQAWYDSPMHVAAMKKFFPTFPTGGKVLAKYKDSDGPFLVVASVTPGDKPVHPDSPLHLGQISIEMYSPLSGGLALGGAFGPKSLGEHGPYWMTDGK